MNKKADTSVLETIIGALIGIGVAVITISTIFFLVKPGNPEVDSLRELATKVREINSQTPGTKGLVVFFQDEASFFYPITEKSRNLHVQRSALVGKNLDFILSHTKHNPDCETNNCLCLCQEFDQEVTKRCKQGKLFCEVIPEVSLSPGTSQIVSRGNAVMIDFAGVLSWITGTEELPPAQQRVQVINCRKGDVYCKNSKGGDISIIFDWLDQQGVYDTIK